MKVKSMSWTRPEIILNKFNPPSLGWKVYFGPGLQRSLRGGRHWCWRAKIWTGCCMLETASQWGRSWNWDQFFHHLSLSPNIRYLEDPEVREKVFYCCLKFCITFLPYQIITCSLLNILFVCLFVGYVASLILWRNFPFVTSRWSCSSILSYVLFLVWYFWY